jgi:hypothetical protein
MPHKNKAVKTSSKQGTFSPTQLSAGKKAFNGTLDAGAIKKSVDNAPRGSHSKKFPQPRSLLKPGQSLGRKFEDKTMNGMGNGW